MDELLAEVYDNLKPKYTSYRFADMVNVGLVLSGVKKSALVHIENKNGILDKLGLNYMAYPKKGLEHLTLLSRNEIKIKNDKDLDVNTGKMLGYLTPGNLDSFTKTDKTASIVITFRKGNGQELTCSVLNQRIKGKTHNEIMKYLSKYVSAIVALRLPKEFVITKSRISIE